MTSKSVLCCLYLHKSMLSQIHLCQYVLYMYGLMGHCSTYVHRNTESQDQRVCSRCVLGHQSSHTACFSYVEGQLSSCTPHIALQWTGHLHRHHPQSFKETQHRKEFVLKVDDTHKGLKCQKKSRDFFPCNHHSHLLQMCTNKQMNCKWIQIS